jgi:sensor histidine kinase YesM
MNKDYFKNGIWQMLLIIAASAFAVIFLNSLSFGLSTETVFDSIFHTIIIGSFVCFGVLLIMPIIQDYSFAKRLLIVSTAIFITALVGILLARLLLGIYETREFGIYYLPSRRTIIFSLIISYIFGFGAYFYITSENKLEETKEKLRQKELDEERAKSLAVQAQLASLESRIHPHFLFNTLNSIAALIKENPDQAEKMVEKLSALLRYSLDFKPNKLVSLEEELKITNDYLEIESVRFAEKLDFNFEVKESLKTERLPAFALQTLVENAIKHVAARRSAKTKINVSASNSDENLKIEVSDNGNGFSESEIKPGHGLDSLRKRLKNIFADRASLEILENTDGGKVRVKIPILNEK